MTVLEIRQLRKDIRGKTIVHPFDYTLTKGQVLALCGGNGAGKSTILRMIAGITKATSGSVRLCGRTLQDDKQGFYSYMGYMPDDFQFGHALTAGETLEFYAGLLGGGAKSRISAVLEEVGLADVRDKKVSSFSKGMRQRLLFAQALLGEPEVLILDEPTNGLDPYWLAAFVNMVNKRKQAGQTVIFSTHQLEAAELTADHVILLQEGQVRLAGVMEQFRDRFGQNGLREAFF